MMMMMITNDETSLFKVLTFNRLSLGPVGILVLACPVGIDAKANTIQGEVYQHVADKAVHVCLLVGT